MGVDRRRMEAIRHLGEAARRRPVRFTVALDDSLVTIRQSPGVRAAVPKDGDEVEIPASGWPTKARVKWDNLEFRLERSFEEGGRIVDHFEVVAGTRLILTRTVEVGRTASAEKL